MPYELLTNSGKYLTTVNQMTILRIVLPDNPHQGSYGFSVSFVVGGSDYQVSQDVVQ
jgi:hypothetical protein